MKVFNWFSVSILPRGIDIQVIDLEPVQATAIAERRLGSVESFVDDRSTADAIGLVLGTPIRVCTDRSVRLSPGEEVLLALPRLGGLKWHLITVAGR